MSAAARRGARRREVVAMVAAGVVSEVRSHAGRGLAPHALTFFGYLALAVWASQYTFDASGVPLIWPAVGLAMAVIWRFGYALAITVVVAALVAHVSLGAAVADGLLLALGDGASAVIGAALLRFLGLRGDLASLSELYKLVGVGVGVTALASGTSGALVAVGVSSELVGTVLLCWLADTMGVVLIAPLVVSLRIRPLTMQQAVGVVAALVLVPLATFVIYASWIPQPISLPLSYAVFPLVMLVALTLPPWVGMATVALTSAVAIHCTGMNKGPFANMGMAPDLLSLHAQLAMLVATAMILAAIRAERLAAEAQAHEHLQALARAGRINAMSALATGIAHEINQPLCALSSYAQGANRMLARGATPEQLREPLERIVATADRASDIVRRTRRFLERGESETGPVDLNALVMEAVELLRPEFRRRNVELRCRLAEQEVPVSVDWLGIQQVVVNLVQNALEAVDEGGNTVQRWVTLRTAANGEAGTAVLSVIDGGPGIADPGDGALFEPFATRRRGGTGLGLAIARSIVEADNGRISVSNEPGAGAHFRVTLPLYRGGEE
ncbi:ATP-binding protein [Aquisalimonas asiatica]|nr:ATP-binding protein [Aquisalimonas asiatica]